jgi:hypothetical protein
VVLPAGGTYLGSTPAFKAPEVTPAVATTSSQDGFVTIEGRIYPYSFEAPDTLKFATFPNDTYDIYALLINNQPPEQNVLIGVDNLARTDELKAYIPNKRAYVENWWKQFGGLKGVSSITPFTNTSGLKGYKAVFINAQNETPNEDIFFETPNPNLVIHLANGALPKAVFNAIVDSVAWKN